MSASSFKPPDELNLVFSSPLSKYTVPEDPVMPSATEFVFTLKTPFVSTKPVPASASTLTLTLLTAVSTYNCVASAFVPHQRSAVAVFTAS